MGTKIALWSIVGVVGLMVLWAFVVIPCVIHMKERRARALPPAYLAEKAKSGRAPAPRPRPPAPAPRIPVASKPKAQRKPKNPNVTRVECKCGKMVALTKTGKLYTHNGDYYTCSYSGTKPYSFIIHEDPI